MSHITRKPVFGGCNQLQPAYFGNNNFRHHTIKAVNIKVADQTPDWRMTMLICHADLP